MEDSKDAVTDELDDDPIIREIPVYHSKSLEDNLYLFQYPMRPFYTKQELNIRKCFVKPQNELVKIEVSIDMDSSNFDEDKAESVAREVDAVAKNKEKETVFENDIVDKVEVSSAKVVRSYEYAVGAFNGKEMHVTSVKGVLQFRPHFSYLNKTTKRKRETDTSRESDDEEAGPSTAEQVTVKFKKTTTDLQYADNSYRSLQRKLDQENWEPTCFYPESSTFSALERLKLFADSTEEDAGAALDLPNTNYLKILVPKDKEQSNIAPCLPSNVVNVHALRALGLQDQCKFLLKVAKIIQFNVLMMSLAGGEGVTADNLLRTLPKVAVLVQGNWIVKSEILYPTGTFSAISGVPADLMCRARDYVLLLFKQNQCVERKKVSSVIRIPAEEVKEIFTGIAKLKHNKGWELALPTDHDFISKHLDIVNRQNLMWDQKAKQVSDYFKDTKDKKQRRKSKSVSEECKSRDCAVSSDNDSGAEKPNNKSPIAVRKSKNNNKLVNSENIVKSDRCKIGL